MWGRIAEIRRYPVKSLLGELLPAAPVGSRGLDGDRLWAVRDAEGKFGSGKNTRRFRRMDGLAGLRACAGPDVPEVVMPDGRRFAADDPASFAAVSEHLGRPVTLAREAEIAHHDEGPVSLITTAGLQRLADLTGTRVESTRFRANLLIDVPGAAVPGDDLPENSWLGRPLRIGTSVVLRPQRPLTRCSMIDMAQDGLPERHDLLKLLAGASDLTFGVWATVLHPGTVTLGDPCGPA